MVIGIAEKKRFVSSFAPVRLPISQYVMAGS